MAIVASDGETGLKYADEYLPVAIILDLHLPRLDGFHRRVAALGEQADVRVLADVFVGKRDRLAVVGEDFDQVLVDEHAQRGRVAERRHPADRVAGGGPDDGRNSLATGPPHGPGSLSSQRGCVIEW